MSNETGIHVDVIDQPIRVEAYAGKLECVDVGAHAWFLGVTRRKTQTAPGVFRVTKTLFYEAQRSMAIREMTKIGESAIERFDLETMVFVHRLGEVPVGEASVLVGCNSPHRISVFEALPWVMDELKRKVPIWKQELYEDGTSEWVHPVETQP